MSKFKFKKPPPLGKIICGDCRVEMKKLQSQCVDLAICDPPYNLGEKYDIYADKKPAREYLRWSREWMTEVRRLLKPDGTFWLFIGDQFASELDVLAKELGFYPRSRVIWFYTFGQNSPKQLTPAHYNLYYYGGGRNGGVFNGDSIKVPSMRQILYKDARAAPGGRLPDNVWCLNPQFLPTVWNAAGDVWCDSRVAGTFKARRGTPNQIPAPIMERIVALCSNPGQVVFDAFVGSGSTPAAAKKLGRRWFGMELSPQYTKAATAYLKTVKVEA